MPGNSRVKILIAVSFFLQMASDVSKLLSKQLTQTEPQANGERYRPKAPTMSRARCCLVTVFIAALLEGNFLRAFEFIAVIAEIAPRVLVSTCASTLYQLAAHR